MKRAPENIIEQEEDIFSDSLEQPKMTGAYLKMINELK